MTHKVDVAILGGGLSGNLLARQLRRQVPDASVVVLERDRERTWKVGESTVEIATDYLTRRLGLTRYLYERHLPKNGLRFFFDTEARDAELHQMSEIGLMGLPPYPSFQLDRARLEADLLEMNARDGVDVRVGARLAALDLDAQGHRLTVVEGDERTEWTARWVVDCTGRAGTIARQLDLRLPEPDHRIAASWGRFRGVADMDDWPQPEWRARARHTARYLSTNHFCYPGKWIWFIPLREGVVSVGVVAEASQWDRRLHSPDGFVEHLREHRAPAQLLEDAELLDVGAFTQLSFRTKRFFGDRWALVGDASAFADPFYSPGSDFIAIENDLVADLVRRDLAGEDLAQRVEAYDALMHFRFDTTMLLYQDQYSTLGSYELFRAKVFFDCACYYNLWFDSYARDEHLDLKAVQGVLRRKGPVLAAMKNFQRLFSDAAATLMKRGDYYRMNTGEALLDGRSAFGPIENVGRRRRRPEIDQRTEEIFNATTKRVRQALEGERLRYVPQPIYAFAEEGHDLTKLGDATAAHP